MVITLDDILKILQLYDKEKSIVEELFGNSKAIVRIASFVKLLIQNPALTNDDAQSQKRKLTCRELINLYRLLIDIGGELIDKRVEENTATLKTIIRLLELFYPKMEEYPRTKLRQKTVDETFERVFRTLDKYKIFDNDPEQFLNLCAYMRDNYEDWRVFFFVLGNNDDPIHWLEYYSSTDSQQRNLAFKECNRGQYYHQIVQALWMLKQLNIMTKQNVNIIKRICLPKIKYFSNLPALIDICAITHENLLLHKWDYEEFKREKDEKLTDSSSEYRGKHVQRWLVELFATYELLDKAIQTSSEKDLSKFINSFDNLSNYGFYSNSQKKTLQTYCATIRTLHDHKLLTPELVLVILGYSEPQLLLKIILHLNKKPNSDELYCLKNLRIPKNQNEDVVVLFNKNLEKHEIIKNARVLAQGHRSRMSVFASLPRDVLVEIAKFTATTLSESEAKRLASQHFDKPMKKSR